MNTRILLAAAVGATLCLYGCHSRTQETETWGQYEKPDTVNGIQQMKDYHYSAEVKDRDRTYTYDIVREASDSLPVVNNGSGAQFSDNRIRLRINRNGTEMFNHEFTKNQFASMLDKEFLAHSILEGMAFDCVTPDGLRFSISISYPESDIYIPFSVLVAPDGTYRVAREEILDTASEAQPDSTEAR